MILDEDRMLMTLKRQGRENDKIYRNLASGLGLAESEFWILYMLAGMTEGCFQQDICRELLLPKQTVNSAIRSLCRKNLIFLERVETTRNKKKVCLTEQGKQLSAWQMKPIREAERKAFLKLDRRERESLEILSRKYAVCLREEMDLWMEEKNADG